MKILNIFEIWKFCENLKIFILNFRILKFFENFEFYEILWKLKFLNFFLNFEILWKFWLSSAPFEFL